MTIDQASATKVFPCDYPDCEHVSSTPQGLGAHRRFSHGIKGKFAGQKKNTSKRTPKEQKETPEAEHTLSFSVMLKHLFPDGIPPKKIDLVLEWIELTRKLVK